MKKRVVIAGLGDTGLLVAVYLSRDFDVVGISPKPCLVSGQELGTRLARPDLWKRDYLMAFSRYRKLDQVRTVHGRIEAIDPETKHVDVRDIDGAAVRLPYDFLVLSSGVTNGFWRNDRLETLEGIERAIEGHSRHLEAAPVLAVVGGGPSGVSSAANLADRFATKEVHFFFSDAQPLPGYHPKVRGAIEAELNARGVHLHPGHRAALPADLGQEELAGARIEWTTGQPAFRADAIVWAVGKTKPNSGFVPRDMLDDHGFVRADENLRVPGYADVFAVGDIAASDPNRSSARNWGFRVVADNIRALAQDSNARLKRYKPTKYRWGSILGVQADGLRVFHPSGASFRFPLWSVRRILFPLIVRRIMYRGIRDD